MGRDVQRKPITCNMRCFFLDLFGKKCQHNIVIPYRDPITLSEDDWGHQHSI